MAQEGWRMRDQGATNDVASGLADPHKKKKKKKHTQKRKKQNGGLGLGFRV